MCLLACGVDANAQAVRFSSAQSNVAQGLFEPFQISVDLSGNVYVADAGNNRVLKETPGLNGYSQSVVGSGLNFPYGVAADHAGNVYIADTENNRVLKETAGWGGYQQSVVLSSPVGVPGGVLSDPFGLAVDGHGDLFISDVFNNRVLRETPAASGYQLSVVDSIANGVHEPVSVAVDPAGSVYVSTYSTATFPFFTEVLKETPTKTGYQQSLVAGGFEYPFGIAADNAGDVYVADYQGGAIYEESVSGGGYVRKLIPTAGITSPIWVAVDQWNSVYVTDAANGRVVRLDPFGGFFGGVEVGSTSQMISAIFTFDTAGTLGPIAVRVLGGGAGQEFYNEGTGTCQAGNTYAAGASCTVDVVYKPRMEGIRIGTVQLWGRNARILATGFIAGQGQR